MKNILIVICITVLIKIIYDVASNYIFIKKQDKALHNFLDNSNFKNRTYTHSELLDFEYYLKTHFHGYEFFIEKRQFINNEDVLFLFDNADKKDIKDFIKALDDKETWYIDSIGWINHNYI